MLFPDKVSVSVDNVVYGTIFPPKGGFSSLASNLQLENSDKWKQGSNFAPFDKEVQAKQLYIFVKNIIFLDEHSCWSWCRRT